MKTHIPAGWKLVPIEPTDEMEAAAENDYEQTGATFPRWKSAYAAMLAAAPEAPPITVALDPDPRGVSVGVWQGSSCIYNGAHAVPEGALPARDWELSCDHCNGDGVVYVERRVGPCQTDIQTFKEECECCEGRGFVFAFEDIPGIAEYVRKSRPAADAPLASMARAIFGDQIGGQMDAMAGAPAAGDALDAKRYRWLRHEGREEKHQDDGAIYVRQVQLTSGVITGSAVLVEEDLDAAIDAALAAQVPQQGEA